MTEMKSNEPVVGAQQYSTAPAWNPQTTSIVSIGFALLLGVLGVIFWSVIPLALTTVVIAYLLNPITNFIEQYVTRGRRSWAVLFTFILIVVVVLLILFILIPPLVEQTISGITSLLNTGVMLIREPIIVSGDSALLSHPETNQPIAITDYVSLLMQEQGFDTFNEWIMSVTQNLSLDRTTIQQIFNLGGDVTTTILGSIFSITGSIIGLLFNSLFFVSILAILLSGGKKMTISILSAVPDGYQDDARKLLSDLAGVWDDYVRGNLTLGLIMGVAMWLFATILGLPNPLFLAFVAFAMEFIPNIGPTIAMVVAAVLALASGSTTFPETSSVTIAGIIVIVWTVAQQLEANLLVPRIVGDNLKLHPVIVILAVIWGGSFGGIIGIIIAPPLVASIRIILQYIYGRLTGRAAFVEPKKAQDTTRTRLYKLYKRLQSWLTKQTKIRQTS